MLRNHLNIALQEATTNGLEIALTQAPYLFHMYHLFVPTAGMSDGQKKYHYYHFGNDKTDSENPVTCSTLR